MDDPEVTIQEQMFHNAVRELIISLLLFILLYVVSYVTLCQFRKRADNEDMYAGEEDAAVYRISLWLCTGTLSVSVGAVLLLPISIISNEVLLLYPDSYYIKWLNSSLIQGLWNHVFFFSNLALFILMPFAYFFTEAEGFSGSRKGLMSRVKEASLVLFLLGILVLGLAYVASAIISGDEKTKQTLSDVWHEHLPYLYSCISFIGVLVLLMCTPVGVARMFTVMGQLIVKPQFLRGIEDQLSTLRLEEENLLRKITYRNGPCQISNGHGHSSIETLIETLEDTREAIKMLESRQHISFWRRNLCYPLVMLLLLAITVFSILIVLQNTFLLLVGTKSLPRGASDTVLGISSLSSFGSIGAALQIVVILYLMVASVVGFYSLPYLRNLQPRRGDTAMVKIIMNCVVLLLLSSALPILSKTLGITNFDLVGNFGSMDWLGNFYIIFLYNILFAVSTALCLFTKFTGAVRREIYDRLKAAVQGGKKVSAMSHGVGSAANLTNGKTESMKEE
ncbi:limb region 1 protein homolog isoform X2 [Physella acuta]|uniref:limb region 1 protein homolog isoform X2 n=1 Tax=Physella acuta TaxID=109671 RepID=UPI0027DB1C2A|nr:limb region 1 protein homolog isoform X2 [Physella acuta]